MRPPLVVSTTAAAAILTGAILLTTGPPSPPHATRTDPAGVAPPVADPSPAGPDATGLSAAGPSPAGPDATGFPVAGPGAAGSPAPGSTILGSPASGSDAAASPGTRLRATSPGDQLPTTKLPTTKLGTTKLGTTELPVTHLPAGAWRALSGVQKISLEISATAAIAFKAAKRAAREIRNEPAERQAVIAGGGDPDGDVQRQALTLINAHRHAGGCTDLALNRKLIAAADGHAADMARHDYFAHEDRSGAQPGQRLDHAGYRWQRYGENIARGQSSVRAVVDAWWHSPAHRENIMDCGLRETGFGLAFGADRTPFWVQVSAVPITTS